MSIRKFGVKIVLLVVIHNVSHTMSFDNRFFPLIKHPYITVDGRPSHAIIDPFVMTASKGFGEVNDEEIGIPELFGPYNLQDVAESFVTIGQSNPLPSKFQGKELPYIVRGRIQAQGVGFGMRQALTDNWSVGFTWFFMRSNSRQEFTLKKADNLFLTSSEQLELDEIRRQANERLGLQGPDSSQLGVSDMDLFVRISDDWDYTLRFRHIEAGLQLGVLAPSGVVKDINNPASLPFGGNGFWGIYAGADGEFELKEDLKAGFLLRVNKRLPRTGCYRMAVNKAPYVYGPVVGKANVNPGLTVIFSPYASFENLREGLGARVQYTLMSHMRDCWLDKRSDKTIPVDLSGVMNRSPWGADYVTLNVFYDFGKVKVVREFDPIVTFAWDIPVSLLVTHGTSKTFRVSLGLEYNY